MSAANLLHRVGILAAMRISLPNCVIRSFQPGDADALARHANNRNVWRNLRDQFPHPYKLADARELIARAREESPEVVFAIEVEGEAAGGVGVRLRGDVERVSGEIGYWLGESLWGRGLMTEVLRAFVPYALAKYRLQRLDAWVFEWNPASGRVLEKVGFVREAVMRRSAVKDGQVIDRWLYAYVADQGDKLAE